jgi:hypothetical protein
MNLKHHYVSSNGGEMYSTYVGGATGRGCDYLVIDDPHKNALENMETTVNYARQTLFTRLNEPERAALW